MRIYSDEEEQQIYLQTQVRAWARSGLLDKTQGDRGGTLDAELRTDLKRTNQFLRLVLAVFTMIISSSVIGLVFLAVHPTSNGGSAALLLFASAVCVAIADRLIVGLRIYRYGVEEALVAMAVGMAAFGAGLVFDVGRDETGLAVALLAGTVTSLAAYGRYGFVYALLAAIACAAASPFPHGLRERTSRILAAAILCGAFAATRALRRRHDGTFRADEYETAESVSWAGAYVLLNLVLTDPKILFGAGVDHDWFYWATYVVTWLMPAVGLAVSIRDRNRLFLTTNVALAIATLATNKSYLGLPRYSWDPMLLGALLAGVAIGVRRWLASGEGGERHGFTPKRLLVGDTELLQAAANLSAGLRAHPAPPAPDQPPGFGGGRSGGGGASGSY